MVEISHTNQLNPTHCLGGIMQYYEAHNLFESARYPCRGKPLEGSKNLRLVKHGEAEYHIQLWGTSIVAIKPCITYWRVAYDSLCTRRHLNNHIPTFVLFTHRGDLWAREGRDSQWLIDTSSWYCSTAHVSGYYSGKPEYMLSKRYADGTHEVMLPAHASVRPRRHTIDERVITDPRRGQTFYYKGKTYIWVEEGKMTAYEYMGEAQSWNHTRWVYLRPDKLTFDPDNVLYPVIAAGLVASGDAVPIKPFNGSGKAGMTWNLDGS